MNEELQSTHEELQAINDELRICPNEADKASSYLKSVLAGVKADVVEVTLWRYSIQLKRYLYTNCE